MYHDDYEDEDWVDPAFTEEFTNQLLRMCAELGIQVKWAPMNPYTPPASNPKHKTIAMNSNWHNPEQIPLQLAHEIEHILHKDFEYAILYFTTGIKKTIERDANYDAIRLLVRIFIAESVADATEDKNIAAQTNYVDFAKALGIPVHMKYMVKDALAEYDY